MSFRLKTIAGIAVIQTLLLIMIIGSSLFLMKQSHEKELRQRSGTPARLFATTIKGAVLSMDLASLKSFVHEIMKNQDVTYVRVLNAEDMVLAEEGPPELLIRHPHGEKPGHDLDESVFETSAEINEAGIRYGRVEIGITTRTILGSLQDARRKVAYIALAELVLSIVLSILLGSYLVRRLSYLKEASERISSGELGYQIDAVGNDEIGVTAKAFNRMSMHLRNLLAEINAKNLSLETEITKRREVEAKLQHARDQLEKRVAERTEELAAANIKLKNEIEERRVAEARKKELEIRVKRMEKMEAIGLLAGGVAHDLNNVLSGIVTFPDILLLKIEDDSPLREPLTIIRESGQRAAAVVQDLLTLSRRGVVATKVLNLNRLIEEYLSSPEHRNLMSRRRNIEIKTDLENDLLNIEGSRVHLCKTIMNLVTNAIEAMPEGGEIIIQTENRYIDNPFKGYDAIVEGDYVVINIVDQGMGISPEDRERIFEPFYTKKYMGYTGTGLGMSVVWGTVKDHCGYIDLNSIENQGCTFSLYFPCTRKPLDEETASIPLDRYRGNGEKILVVDDIPEQRKIASALLSELGYMVDTVPSGEAALTFLAEYKFDLIVLDMIMEPGLDGLDTGSI